MEPHEIDRYIRDKIRENENMMADPDDVIKARVWNSIVPSLEKRNPWMKIAALMLLLLMPTVYLVIENQRQGEQIAALTTKLSHVSQRPPQPVRIIRDTIRQTVYVNTVTAGMAENVRIVTDTVRIYLEPEMVAIQRIDTLSPRPQTVSDAPENNQGPLKAEFVFAEPVSAAKQPPKPRKSFSVSIGMGRHKDAEYGPAGFRARL